MVARTVAARKDKGRRLQKWVCQQVLARYLENLTPDDVRSTSMGANGVDVQLSAAGKRAFPYAVECKNLAKHSAYSLYEQARSNAGGLEPLVVLKVDSQRPVVIVDAEHFLNLQRRGTHEKDL